MDISKPRNIRQHGNIFGDCYIGFIYGIGIISVKPDIMNRTCRAVGFDKSSGLLMTVAVGINYI